MALKRMLRITTTSCFRLDCLTSFPAAECFGSGPAARTVATRAAVFLSVSTGAGPVTERRRAIPIAACGCLAILRNLVPGGGVGEKVFERAALAVSVGGDGLGVLCWGGKGNGGEECCEDEEFHCEFLLD
ncbi:hypothetical protein CVT25_002073 [Psilocybe cyanescens]|uniref:Uncharacterized protein n=1 Tax=Psilocybe cyanescens TaxID=93625 RepID=A0A409X9A3_PSICY|nr:hypothetical protein CVT25_002073 [Psilocybe cyanescens]